MTLNDKYAVIMVPGKSLSSLTFLKKDVWKHVFWFADEWNGFSIVELRHPRNNKGQLFAFNGDKTKLAEVIAVSDPHAAWFIGNTIGE